MSTNYKNIVITPNRDSDAANVPSIRFSGGDATSNTDINVRVYTTQSGTLSFEGSAGQLFSITNDLTNTIFSVNDVSGIPSLEIDASGKITFAQYGGNVGIGTSTPSSALDVNGKITGNNFNSSLNTNVASPSFAMGTTGIWSRNNSVRLNFAINGAESGFEVGTNLVALASTAYISWTSGTLASSNPDLFLQRDAANTLAQRYGTTAQTSRIYGTYTDVSNYERLSLSANSSGHYIIGQQAGTGSARPLFFGSNNATAVTIDTAGRVGIGNTTPSYKLQVEGGDMFVRNISSAGRVYFPTNGVVPYIGTTSNQLGIEYGSYNLFFTRAGGTDVMTLGSTGNVGIGNTAPTTKLHVAGVITSSGVTFSSGSDYLFTNKINNVDQYQSLETYVAYNNVVPLITWYGGTGAKLVYNTNILALYPSITGGIDLGTSSLKWKNGYFNTNLIVDGNVGIGTTVPTAKLHVTGNVIIDNALTITQSSLTTSANISTTGVVSTNELVLSNTNVAALHRSPNAITALNIYDTSKDSDGGAWTEKCQSASWYNEPLAGKWLGSCTSEGAARLTGGPVGAEQVVDGTFANGTANWTAQLSATLTAAAGELTVTSAGNNSLAYQFLPISALAPIRITIRLVRGAGYFSIGAQTYSLNVGDNVFNIPAGLRTNSKLDLAPNVGTTAVFSNVSVKEVTALTTASNDYFQLSTDGKFYRLYKNLLKASGDVTNSIWLKAATTILSGQTALDGSATAFKLVENTANSSHELYQNGLVYFINTFYATTVYAKASGRTKFRIQIQNNGGNATQWEFDLTAVTATNTYSSWTGHGATITDVGSGWYRCTLYGQSPAIAGTHVIMSFQLSNGTNSYTGDGTSGVLLWRPQVELSNAFTSYEETSATWEIFRGNKADFPRLAAIVAEGGVIGANSITIYDLTEPGRPMWMRFFGDGANYTYDFLSPYPISSFAILNGVLAIGLSYADLSYYGHMYLVNFPADTLKVYEGYYGRGSEYLGGISLRQESTTSRQIAITTPYYPSGDIRAIAMTVLPDAPMDPVTGLKVPTIALATGAGVSIIKHNGTAVTMTHQNYETTSVAFLENEKIAWGADASGDAYVSFFHVNKIPSVTTDYGSYFNPSANLEFYASRSWGGGSPTIRFADSDSYMVKTVLANQKNKVLLFSNYFSAKVHGVQRRPRATGTGGSFTIAPTYNTGWMAGDIRRAYLSDTSIDSAVGGELLSNPNFNSDLSSWTINQATSWVSGAMRLQSNGGADPNSYSEIINVKPGTVYEIVMTLFGSDTITRTSYIRLSTNGTPGGAIDPYVGDAGQAVNSGITTVRRTLTLIPAGVTQVRVSTSLSIGAGVSGAKIDVLDVSAREVVPDRSYKTASAAVNGTISRAKVANNTSLVGYSGFSTSNYLRESYSADLDFGTGEFTASAWVNIPATLPANSFTIISSNLYAGLTPGFSDANGSAASWNAATSTATVTTSGFSYPYLVYNVSSLSTSRAYEVEVQLTSNSSLSWASVSIWLGWTNGQNLNSSGYAKFIIMPTDGTTYISLGSLGTPPYSVTVQTLSIREVAIASIADRAYSSGSRIQLGFNGVGKLQATAFDGANTRTVTTASTYNIAQWLKAEANYTTDGSLSIRVNGREVAVTRGNPLLSLNSKYNLFTFTNDWSVSPWSSQFSVTAAANAGSAPDATNTATSLVYSQQYANRRQAGTVILASGVTYTFSFYAKRISGNTELHIFHEGIGSNFTSFTITDTWQRYSVTLVGGGGGANLGIQDRNASGWGEIHVWGAQLEIGSTAKTYQRVGAATDFDFQAPLTIGNNYAANTPFPGSIALLKLGATVPTYEQSQFMYDQEKQLFRANAISVLPDTGAIVDMAYDDATDRWAAVSATNESYWNGLIRNSVTASPAGSYTKISTTSGVELASRSTTNPGVDVSIPAYGLREELVKRSESAARLTKELIVLDYVGGFTASTTNGSTAITSVTGLTYPTSYIGAVISGSGIPANTTIVAVSGTTIYLSASSNTTSSTTVSFLDFKLPVGMETKTVMVAGTVKQEGATKDYTRLYDGFIETIRFGVAPGTAAWVQIQATKGNV